MLACPSDPVLSHLPSQCLTQLALCNTVNHECEPHYHHHRNYPAFVLQLIVGAKNIGSFRKRNPLSACCLSPYRLAGSWAEPHTYMLLALDDELLLFQHFLLYYGFILRKHPLCIILNKHYFIWIPMPMNTL